MSKFEALIECIDSGQLSARQFVAEMSDPVFAAYYRQRKKGHLNDHASKAPTSSTASFQAPPEAG